MGPQAEHHAEGDVCLKAIGKICHLDLKGYLFSILGSERYSAQRSNAVDTAQESSFGGLPRLLPDDSLDLWYTDLPGSFELSARGFWTCYYQLELPIPVFGGTDRKLCAQNPRITGSKDRGLCLS